MPHLHRSWTALAVLSSMAAGFTHSPPTSIVSHTLSRRAINYPALEALSKRELEIRRKIKELKKDGRLRKNDELDDDDDDDDDEYLDKIRKKLGTKKSKMLGFEGGSEGQQQQVVEGKSEEMPQEAASGPQTPPRRKAQIGAIPSTNVEEDEDDGSYRRIDQADDSIVSDLEGDVDDSMDDDDDKKNAELSEEDLVDLVAKRMQEKRDTKEREREAGLKQKAKERLAALEEERQQEKQQAAASKSKQTTSGIGGTWERTEKTEEDVYQPKSGSWGAFPRPRDISKAYGGGRRVGPGFSNEKARSKSVDETRAKLQNYRVKVGIDVESEKEHASDIDEALKIGTRAMQRGMYSTAVSALEKVTKYCSTNSKVGGKVFLELAMAYEAVGRPKEAITVYSTLSRSRIEDIKINAKRLLYGIEAMQFMQENVSGSEFSRKKAKTTFIDTTGLANIASNFDDVYETAYIDLDKGFYKKLTESVVRSSREARQILLQATGPGEVGRLRIVQALRSLSRNFADALQKEIEKAKPVAEPTAVMNGKPILQQKEESDRSDPGGSSSEFFLLAPDQMVSNLEGEWRLQLIADKRGDGVKFFNNTLAWQQVDTDTMSFSSLSPQGFLTVQQSGNIVFSSKRRILRRRSVEVSGGGGLLTGLFGARTGAVGAIRAEQQVVTVDSAMLVTQGVPNRRAASKADEKDYFAVWRRVAPGTYSELRP